MTTRGYCNEQYYGKKLSVEDILSSSTVSNDDGVTHQPFGAAKMLRRNKDYETLIQMLNDYCVDEHLDNNNYIPPEMAEAVAEDKEEREHNEEVEHNGHLMSEEDEQLGQIQNGNVHHKELQNGAFPNGQHHGDIDAVEIGFADKEDENDEFLDPEVDLDPDQDQGAQIEIYQDGQIVNVAMSSRKVY